ncbi:MAG TPA: patatin-like phospholipase family protein [Gemmatimonadales bacterium]|nr:patatin-like phospholipase family protein [Gemmatimonadales bacterium]
MNGPGVVAVLSGGGAKASAHIGAFRALEEAELVPSHLVGTSMGAVFAALFACGLPAREALDRVASVGEKEIVNADPFAFLKGLWAKSLLRGAPFRAALERMIPARRFSELQIPLTVTATELGTGTLTLFGAGGADIPLIDALCAGSALPVFLPPVELNGRRYADGGLRAVLPLEPALLFPSRLVVAVDVGSGFDEGPSVGSDLPPLVQTHADAMGILMAGQTAQALALWRGNANRPPLLYVRPRVDKGGTFKVDQVRRYVEEGYSATRAVLAGLNSGDGVAD